MYYNILKIRLTSHAARHFYIPYANLASRPTIGRAGIHVGQEYKRRRYGSRSWLRQTGKRVLLGLLGDGLGFRTAVSRPRNWQDLALLNYRPHLPPPQQPRRILHQFPRQFLRANIPTQPRRLARPKRGEVCFALRFRRGLQGTQRATSRRERRSGVGHRPRFAH